MIVVVAWSEIEEGQNVPKYGGLTTKLDNDKRTTLPQNQHRI
jgi:hypothetical protein